MIIEHLVFRPAPGVDDAALLAADEAVQEGWAPFQSGFVRRTTARSADGRWLVETFWSSEESAAAAAMTRDEPVWTALLALADPESVTTARWTTLD